MSQRLKWIALILLISVPFLAGIGFSKTNQPRVAPEIGAIAPDFILKNIAGEQVTLSTVYKKNRLTLINFWATYCPPCRSEIPHFIKVYKEHQKLQFELLAINPSDSVRDLLSFKKAEGINFPILSDLSGKIANSYNIYGIPTTFFVDQKGVIKDMVIGGMSEEELRTRVAKFSGVK